MSRRAILVLCLIVAIAVAAIAKGSSTPLVAEFLATSPYGVNGDGYAYANNVRGNVDVYLSSSQTLVVMTYSSGRTLSFHFDPASPAWQAANSAAGLPQFFAAEIDLNGINYYGTFTGMALNSVAQVKTDLRFHYAGSTWNLAYPSLAVQRTSATTWEISSEQTDIPYPAIASSSASLQVQRRRSNTNYGTVDMPVHFTITLQ